MAGLVESLLAESAESYQNGNMAEALRITREAVEAAVQSKDSSLQVRARLSLGLSLIGVDQVSDAQEQAELALKLVIPRTEQHAQALLIQGICAGRMMEMEKAHTLLLDAGEIAQENQSHLMSVRVLYSLAALVYAPRGQFELALKMCLEALNLVQSHDLWPWSGGALATLSFIAWRAGKLDIVDQTVRRLKDITEPTSLYRAWQYVLSAILAMEDNHLSEALSLLDMAFERSEKSGSPILSVYVRIGYSYAARLQQNYAEALAWAQDALARIGRAQHKHMTMIVYFELAQAAWGFGALGKASPQFLLVETYLKQALAIASEAQNDYRLAYASLLMAEYERQTGQAGAPQRWKEAAGLILNGGLTYLLEKERVLIYSLLSAYLNDPDPELANRSRNILELMRKLPFTPLFIKLLGRLNVRVGGRQVPQDALRYRRAGELLATLLLSPGFRLGFDELSEILSPNKPPDFARSVVHKATSALRHALEPELPDRRFPSRYLDVQDNHVCLHLPPGSSVDILDLQALFQQENWQKILEVYTGDLLPEYPYNEYFLRKRASQVNIYHHALLSVAQKSFEERAWHDGLNIASKLFNDDPTNEQAALIAMRSAFHLGNRSEAARIYQKLVKSLAAELGIRPKAEVHEFFKYMSQNG